MRNSLEFIATFPFIDGAELLEACHSMSKPNSPQEKSVKTHACGLLCIIMRLKMPSKCYRSAQMARQFKQDPFIETTSKECQSDVISVYYHPSKLTTSYPKTNDVIINAFVKISNSNI